MVWSKEHQAYVLAASVALAVLFFRYGLFHVLGERAVLLPFVLAVVLAAWWGGLGPGLFATGLCAVLRALLIEPPLWSWNSTTVLDGVNVLIFVLIGVTTSVLCEKLHATRRREIELRSRMLAVAAEEDRRIGFELHDNTQQQLTGLGLLAQSLAENLAERSVPDAGVAARLARGINDVTHGVHLLSRGLIPVDVDAAGLRSALGELAETIAEQYAVSCSFHCAGSVDVADNSVATHLYRIAQEAVTNAVKHGGPDRIELSLIGSAKSVTLNVVDNGTGINTDRIGNSGMGLGIMRYRAELIGGSLQICPASVRGTKVTCTVFRRRMA